MTKPYHIFSFGAIHQAVFAPKAIFPLITFRIAFGLLMCASTLRFIAQGWVDDLFIQPDYFFKYYGFHAVGMPPLEWVYPIHYAIALTALFIALGFLYRISALVFALLFTYVELWDATNYLNHHYLVILLAWGMIFLPAHRFFSIDVFLYKNIRRTSIPAWCIHALVVQFCIVYFHAGLAKINPDWLCRAMPLAIWLPERQNIPVLGHFFGWPWVAYAFSYFGAAYDLSIWAFLLFKKTRPWAYLAVIVFHSLTGILFNIGLFPYIMTLGTLIFFSGAWHGRLYGQHVETLAQNMSPTPPFQQTNSDKSIAAILFLYFTFQILFPMRAYLYPGNLFWHEQGYRFGWRVMAVEKSGTARFFVEHPQTSRKAEIQNSRYLTPFQEKQMSIQPDFILQFAHIIRDDYEKKIGVTPIVTADVHVALNRRASSRFIDPKVDLAQVEDGWGNKDWILGMEKE